MNILNNTINPLLVKGFILFIDNIKILLYKNNSKIFELINFDDDKIYTEPLLYSYFNNKTDLKIELGSILIGYKKAKKQNIKIKTDEFGRIYIPNIGWFSTSEKNQNLIFSKDSNEFLKNEKKINHKFEPIALIENTKIELLQYQIPLLKQCYYDVDSKTIEVEIEKITKKQITNLTKAYNLIKSHCSSQYELIEKYASKCVIFNVDTHQRNSFATKQAHGIAFYNAYQDDYDEVFFVDDIAHQTGHVIFNTLLFEPTDFFKIDKNTVLEKITMPNGDLIENRDLHVIFHALYTYYTSFICLDACLENNAFQGKQKHEEVMNK
uniref:hypothetical protein n=1 Tax=Flavobacterium sp. TaxID=239 RepID=UPI0040476E4C